MNGVETLVGIWMQNTRLWNPPVQQWVETVPSHLCALTATDQNGSPQSAYATPEDAQLTRVADKPLAIVSQCCRTADVGISTGREEGGFCLRQ